MYTVPFMLVHTGQKN